jgi:hypothetical protein
MPNIINRKKLEVFSPGAGVKGAHSHHFCSTQLEELARERKRNKKHTIRNKKVISMILYIENSKDSTKKKYR